MARKFKHAETHCISLFAMKKVHTVDHLPIQVVVVHFGEGHNFQSQALVSTFVNGDIVSHQIDQGDYSSVRSQQHTAAR